MDRTFLYHKAVRKGKIFDDQGEHDQALKDGWVTAPWLVDEVKEVFEEKIDKDRYPKKRKTVIENKYPKRKSGRPKGS